MAALTALLLALPAACGPGDAGEEAGNGESVETRSAAETDGEEPGREGAAGPLGLETRIPAEVTWSFTLEGPEPREVTGDLGTVDEGDGLLALHLVNDDAVNVHVLLAGATSSDDGGTAAELTSVIFPDGRECAHPTAGDGDGASAVEVRLRVNSPERLAGFFEGEVACLSGPIAGDGSTRELLSGRFDFRFEAPEAADRSP